MFNFFEIGFVHCNDNCSHFVWIPHDILLLCKCDMRRAGVCEFVRAFRDDPKFSESSKPKIN